MPKVLDAISTYVPDGWVQAGRSLALWVPELFRIEDGVLDVWLEFSVGSVVPSCSL